MCACPLGWKKTIALMTLKKKGLTNKVRTCSMGSKKNHMSFTKSNMVASNFLKMTQIMKHISLLKQSLGVSTYMS